MNFDKLKSNRVLLIGSWAKEQISIENMKKDRDVEIYVYMDTKNPGIIEIADGHKIGDFYEIEEILNYAKETKPDLVIITTAAPLSAGIVDKLKKLNIAAFGPSQKAAKLESDKAFTRELMRKYRIGAIPRFKVFDDPQKAEEFAEKLNWSVAVKPQGLTDGLGVKVMGDQLKNKDEVIDYIKTIHNDKISGSPRIIVEEKLEGEEFTLQCFVNDDLIVPTPAVQDFKKLLPGEKGLNTASMGSYSDIHKILPFINIYHYNFALKVIKETTAAFKKETGDFCQGFLYGQFMLTDNGIKLIEYNFRPGDPEWMNTLIVLKTNMLDIIENLLKGRIINPEFEEKATVCKYIVPTGYPEKLNQILDVSFSKKEIENLDVNLYYSSGLDEKGRLNVGTERGIAFLSKAETITDAHKKIEEAISKIKGEFFHRHDIGTEELIQSKIGNVELFTKSEPIIRKATEEEFLDIYDFVYFCPPLEYYQEHVFKILLRNFKNTCFVVELNGHIVGWQVGFVSQVDNSKYFLWQIGVSQSAQGKGIGKKLLKAVEDEVKKIGCKVIELTIDPDNIPSQKLFESLEYSNVSSKIAETVKVDGKTAVKDFYSPERHFMVYQKEL